MEIVVFLVELLFDLTISDFEIHLTLCYSISFVFIFQKILIYIIRTS